MGLKRGVGNTKEARADDSTDTVMHGFECVGYSTSREAVGHLGAQDFTAKEWRVSTSMRKKVYATMTDLISAQRRRIIQELVVLSKLSHQRMLNSNLDAHILIHCPHEKSMAASHAVTAPDRPSHEPYQTNPVLPRTPSELVALRPYQALL